MKAFYDFCHEAGPAGCDFYAETPELIEERLGSLLENIRKHPVIVKAGQGVSAAGPEMPQLLTWSHIRRITSAALYQPMKLFKKYATVLAALEAGDGRPFYDMSKYFEDYLNCQSIMPQYHSTFIQSLYLVFTTLIYLLPLRLTP
jgi:hypothetical protein